MFAYLGFASCKSNVSQAVCILVLYSFNKLYSHVTTNILVFNVLVKSESEEIKIFFKQKQMLLPPICFLVGHIMCHRSRNQRK